VRLTTGWHKARYAGPLWDEIACFVDDWVASDKVANYVASYTAERPERAVDDLEKRYIARFLPHDREIVTLDSDDIFLGFALQPNLIKFITNCMGGHQPTLHYYDIWHTFPLEGDRDRIGSQGWHRDAEAFGKPNRVIKVFLYLSDCLEVGAGPFEMVGEAGPVSFSMRRGDLLIADTGAWLHRGGYSTTLPRTYVVWVYTDSDEILTKPRYNLTDEARAKFASPVLFEHRDWVTKRELLENARMVGSKS
jgi:hypothetical protein